MLGSSWVAAQLAAPQVGLNSMSECEGDQNKEGGMKGHEARTKGFRKSYHILSYKAEGKHSLIDVGLDGEDETECGDMDRILLGQERSQLRAVMNTRMNLRVS
jgi:hypothetical protein